VPKPRNSSAGSNLVDVGRFTVRVARAADGDSVLDYRGRGGGHGESLRRTHDDAVGAQLGTDLVDRVMVNVGSDPLPPTPPRGGGQARRRLLATGRGGVLVVVRAWESQVHGEGGQPGSDSGPEGQESTVNTDDPSTMHQHGEGTAEPAVRAPFRRAWWRAGCDESRTSGSEGEPGKRTERKLGTAPRFDPTPPRPSGICGTWPASWSGSTPTPPPACARAWPRCSPSPASGCGAPCSPR
jgi:hypothetical protein